MTDYQIQPNTRRCVATGRELPPGTKFYSVLLEQDGKLVRQDFSSEAWQGPPPGAFSFWAGRPSVTGEEATVTAGHLGNIWAAATPKPPSARRGRVAA